MPTVDELEEIYDEDTENKQGFHLTKLIDLAGEWVWGLDSRDLAISFGFIEGSPAVAFFDGPGSGAWYQAKRPGRRRQTFAGTGDGKIPNEKQEEGDGRFTAHDNGTVSDKKRASCGRPKMTVKGLISVI